MFIKHEKFTDVCIEVRHEKQGADGKRSYYGMYWNLGQSGPSYPIEVETKVIVYPEEFENWLVCLDAKPNLREADWMPLNEQR